MTMPTPPILKPSRPSARPRRWTGRLLWCGLILAAAALFVAGRFLLRQTTVPTVQDLAAALSERRLDDVIRLAELRLTRMPDDSSAWLKLGEAYQRLNRLDDAIRAFSRVSEADRAAALAARLASASMYLLRGELERAETEIEAAQRIDPEHPLVLDQQINLLTLTGQRWHSLPVLQRTLRQSVPKLSYLVYLANADEMPAPPEDTFRNMFAVGDGLGLLGAAYVAASVGRSEQALQLAEKCLARRPDLMDAHVVRETVLLDEGRFSEFDAWMPTAPRELEAHPGHWFNLGKRCRQANNLPGAIRCYWETLRRQPNHDRATYQMSQVLAAHGLRDDAELFLSRSRKLTKLVKLAIEIFDGRQDDQQLWECALLTQQLGRLPESGAWCRVLLEQNPAHRQARDLFSSYLKNWSHEPPMLLPEHDLAARFDGSRFPLPQFVPPQRRTDQTIGEQGRIAFTDEAEASGLHFVYFSGDDPSTPGKRMFEYTGGGVGVLDYDRDGWPDLYFTQGSHYPGDTQQGEYLDALFRNRAGAHWRDVSHAAGIYDARFGQGVSAGDFDNDGFTDLYVANIEGNRLLHNLGDGTFRDVTTAAGLGHEYWTTSCAMADINADGIPDLYDVTFLVGEDVFERTCRGSDGVSRSCAPAGFEAAPDQVFLGNGDGTFARPGGDSGLVADDGDGLGIVVADFDRSGRPSVFVANDGRANFYFVAEGNEVPIVRWKEVAVLSGLAFDEAGMAQACMGVAVSDANNDGLPDLFVTNFYQESNTYYENLGDSSFTDRTRVVGLRQPSLEMLGFGTQFLDADCNGWDDLLVLNGHVDDFTYKHIPYKMPPQLFINRSGRFEELTAETLGLPFQRLRLGRGLATLDWNRDGLMDAAASYIGDPAGLLTNRTPQTGRAVNLQFVGTTGARDAIGARVVVTAGNTVRDRQLTGGDGYQASNERRLIVGLGALPDSERLQLEIHWPGGAVERHSNVLPTGEYLAIEGRSQLVTLPSESVGRP